MAKTNDMITWNIKILYSSCTQHPSVIGRVSFIGPDTMSRGHDISETNVQEARVFDRSQTAYV